MRKYKKTSYQKQVILFIQFIIFDTILNLDTKCKPLVVIKKSLRRF